MSACLPGRWPHAPRVGEGRVLLVWQHVRRGMAAKPMRAAGRGLATRLAACFAAVR